MVGNVDFATPLRNQYARAERDLDRSYRSPLGAYTTADVEEKAKRAQKFDLKQNLGSDLASAALQSQQNAFGQQASVAQLTQPRLYQSGSTSTQSDPWGTALSIGSLGLGAASGALGGKRR